MRVLSSISARARPEGDRSQIQPLTPAHAAYHFPRGTSGIASVPGYLTKSLIKDKGVKYAAAVAWPSPSTMQNGGRDASESACPRRKRFEATFEEGRHRHFQLLAWFGLRGHLVKRNRSYKIRLGPPYLVQCSLS